MPKPLSLLLLLSLGGAFAAAPVMTMGKNVTLDLEAGQGMVNNGLNFNGGYKSNKTFTVPLGSRVTVKFHNAGMMPHSFVVTKGGPAPKDAEVEDAVFKGAYGPAEVEKGLKPGGTLSATFTANEAGSYYIVCGMPGHAPAGQYINLVVSGTAKTASFQ